jgi:GTP pyrophosphokinase
MQDELLRLFRFEDLDDFFQAVGYGGVSAAQIGPRLAPILQPAEEVALPSEVTPRETVAIGLSVLGTGDLLTRMARCCNPVPGDKIIGYVTRGEGVTVHRRDCLNVAHHDEKERLVDVEWGRRGQLYPVAAHIEAWDRVGLLRDISTMVSEEQVNMVAVRTQEHEDGTISIFVTLETSGIEQLTRLLGKLESVRGVISVGRRLETLSGR